VTIKGARKWGPLVAGLFVFGLIGSAFSPDTESEQTPASQASTQTAEAQPTAESPPEPEQEPTLEQTAEPTSSPTQTDNAAEPAVREEEPQSSELSNLLVSLVIEPESPDPYNRSLFRHWIDADGDGCNARREVLIAEAIEAPTIGDRCDLIGGLWYSAFDGVTTDDDSSFDVDHMVPLSEAWDSGANEWSSDRRRAFANDLDLPQALIAVSASSNRSKGDKDPADWLPPLQSYRCQYVEDWVRVKVKWELSVDQREFSAIRGLLATC